MKGCSASVSVCSTTLRVAMSSRKGARAVGEKGATWVQEYAPSRGRQSLAFCPHGQVAGWRILLQAQSGGEEVVASDVYPRGAGVRGFVPRGVDRHGQGAVTGRTCESGRGPASRMSQTQRCRFRRCRCRDQAGRLAYGIVQNEVDDAGRSRPAARPRRP